jgi:hypothetical protein
LSGAVDRRFTEVDRPVLGLRLVDGEYPAGLLDRGPQQSRRSKELGEVRREVIEGDFLCRFRGVSLLQALSDLDRALLGIRHHVVDAVLA